MNRLSFVSASALAACLFAASPPACAQEARVFNIPAGSLRDALNLFATQSDQQILFSSDLVAGRRTAGLNGAYAPSAALDRLLAGTGLVWRETRPGVIFLGATDVAADEVTRLEEVIVTGSLLRGTGPLSSPVVVLDRDALDRRGRGGVAEVLADLPQNYAGSGTPGAVLGFADPAGGNSALATGINLRGLGVGSTLTLVNGRRLAGTGSRGAFADASAIPSAAVERVDVLLDGASALYTAFSALDPLTQDKVAKLTGSVTETRTSRSSPSGFGAGRSTVSRSEVERPLLEPGEIRALPDHLQLVFVAGQRPLRSEKLLYDRREPFRSRAHGPLPDQALGVDAPGAPPHPWLGRRSLGRDDGASLPLFKEVAGAMDDRRAAARAADIYGRVAQEMAAQQAVLDQLQGGSDG